MSKDKYHHERVYQAQQKAIGELAAALGNIQIIACEPESASDRRIIGEISKQALKDNAEIIGARR